eukprot:GABV01003107.1.p1 GENE.GABV01003107.1~~GABV01003107.1.p1  ORF type:complete len:135 (-),score=34.91 GABV01003107.1:98-502(-)
MVGDLGVSRAAENTALFTQTGTFGYLAPEIPQGSPYNALVDIYSLGVVLHELISFERLPDYHATVDYFDTLRKDDVPQWLKDLCRMMIRVKGDRPTATQCLQFIRDHYRRHDDDAAAAAATGNLDDIQSIPLDQ